MAFRHVLPLNYLYTTLISCTPVYFTCESLASVAQGCSCKSGFLQRDNN